MGMPSNEPTCWITCYVFQHTPCSLALSVTLHAAMKSGLKETQCHGRAISTGVTLHAAMKSGLKGKPCNGINR